MYFSNAKEKPENNAGIVVPEEMADQKQNEAKIVSQLSRDLTPEMLEHETLMLGRVHFPLKQKQVASMKAQFSLSNADNDNFTALDWYA